MRRAWAALAVALLATPVLAEPTPAAGVQTQVILGLPADLARLEEVNPARSDTDQVTAPCGAGHIHSIVGGSGFRFFEGPTERGCAEARMPFLLPEGAQAVQVRFRADRTISQPASTDPLPVEMPQLFRLYLGPREPLPVQEQALFPAQSPESSPRVGFAIDLAVPPGARDVVLAWYFEDRGPSLGQAVPNPLYGQGLAGDVTDIVLEAATPPPIPEKVTRRQRDADQSEATEITTVRVQVPGDILADYAVGLRFRGGPGLSLAAIEGPDGTPLPLSDVEAAISGGLLLADLPAGIVALHGPGTYRVTFHGKVPLEPTPWLMVVVPFLMASPPVAAFRSWRETRRLRVGGAVTQGAVGQMRLMMMGVLVAYGAAMAWFAVGPQWPLVVAWPITSQAAAFHVVLVACSASLVGTLVWGRRRLVGALDEDLSEKRRLNVELQRSNRELEQFAYVASHDLQEPLRTIASYTQLLDRRYGKRFDAEGKEFLGYVVDGAGRMQSLIHDLLEYSRVGTRPHPFQETDLDPLVDQAVSSLHVAIEEAGAQVVLGAMPRVLCDGRQMAQVFQNLLANALKFRSPRRRARVEVTATDAGDAWSFAVADNGIGIAPEHFERIFIIFQRLHAREEYPGTGIGLALCRRIVERHGGRIWVESVPGQGSTFHFTLPKDPPRPLDDPHAH